MGNSVPHTGEFVVEPDLAEVAERLGVPLQAGCRVRFEVIDSGEDEQAPGEDSPREPWPPAWFGSITTDEGSLGANVRQIMRAELGKS